MGCGASLDRDAPPKGTVSPKSDARSCPDATPASTDSPRHGGSINRSAAVSATTQSYPIQRRVSAAAARTGPMANSLPDPLQPICLPMKDHMAVPSTEPSSSRLSLAQLRPAMISHSDLIAIRPPSGPQTRANTSPTEKNAGAEQRGISSLLQEPQQQQQQKHQAPVSTVAEAFPRHPSSPASQPTLQLSYRRVSDSTATATPKTFITKGRSLPTTPVPATTSPTSKAIALHHAATVDTTGLDVEYLDDGGNFDIDSTDEDSETGESISADRLHITLSSTAPGRGPVASSNAERELAVKKRQHRPAVSSSPPPSTSHGAIAVGGGGGRLQQARQSASLVSLADSHDGMFTPTSPRSNGNDRLGSESPIFNGLVSGTGSRPTSSCMVGEPRNGRVDQASNNGLATFFNQPRECANCKSPAVAFACEVCEDFFLCEDCRFDVDLVHAIHDPTHAMLSMQDNHCSSSRTFGGDSIFSLSGEGGASSLFNPPCSRCGRVIDDTEPVYRCEQCDYVLCQECFFKPPEQGVAVDGDSPHEHILKRFQRKSKSGSIHEGAVINKTRNSGGNRVINDYVVVRLLGRGSYAKVKLVQHIRTQELFALKILKKQKKSFTSTVNLGRSRAKLASNGVSDDDLLREIAVMKFIDHPNITKLKEVIEDVEAQKVYVIMEYCENGPVHVMDTPPLPLEKVRQYGADIARGLLHLHSEFLYHRDVKPANCLVNHEFVVKIADFGTCNSQVRTKSSEGTLAFSCPEQVRGEEVSGEVVDSWAFALTLYEMAYGTLPVSTTSLMQHRNTLLGPEPISIPQTGDLQLRDLLAAMLNKRLKDRMLLSAVVRHPFFAAFHIDPHGTPYTSAQLNVAKRQQQHTSASSSPTAQGSPSSRNDQQRPPPEVLTELYEKALGAVYRGKNLKDCFHGVRALRRIRRKEAETARLGGGNDDGGDDDDGAGNVNDDDEDYDMAYSFGEDERNEGLPGRSGGADGESPSRSPAGHGNSSNHSNSCNDDDKATSAAAAAAGAAKTGVSRGVKCGGTTGTTTISSKENETATAEAASVVEEIVLHHLSSKEPRVEVSYVSLSRQSTVEKLNQLSAIATELRLGHNELTATTGLRFTTFSVLKEVSITFNRLEAFPEEIFLVPRLVRLDLSHNHIPVIPPSLVSRAPFLERLNLHHNHVAHVGTVTWPAATDSPVSATANEGVRAACSAGAARVVSVLAAPCLRHVRLSGNPLESLPLALETTNRLELVLDAVPALMEQWHACTQSSATTALPDAATAVTTLRPPSASTPSSAGVNGKPHTTTTTVAVAARQPPPPPQPLPPKNRLPAVIVWDDSFPVRIPDVEPAVWLAVNNMAVYRVQTLRTCRTRRVVLCQCADPRFPNGAFDSADLAAYFEELAKALQEQRQVRQQQQQLQPSGSFDGPGASTITTGALPPIVGRAARSYVESYFFVTDDESEEDGGYHDLVAYLSDALAAKEPVLVVVVTSGNTSAVRTSIVAALSTCLTQLRGTDPNDISEQAELVVNTMRSLYA